MTRARDVANVLSTSTALATDTETAAAISSHNSASDPHGDRANAATLYAPLSNPTFTAIGGSEGGQINLAAAPSNTTLSGNINLDVYQNRVRLFEGGGNNRGAYVDLTTLSNGVGSELLASSPQSGNTGKYLVTNGTTAIWQENQFAGKNLIINGAMEIWQRGTSFPSGVGLGANVVYSADRWHWYRGLNDTGGTLSRQSAGLTGFRYCIRMQRNSGNTSTQALGLRYTAETADSLRFAGKQVTLSFWARKGANYSPSGNGFRATIATGTGTDQVVHSFTGFTYIADQTITLSDTWTRYSITGTCSSNITQIGLEMFATPTGTAGANDYMEITGIQLEEGPIATSFYHAGGSIANELVLCQRYYEQSFSAGTAPSQGAFATVNGVASAYSASDMRTQRFDFKVTKRVVPTMTYYRSNDTATDSRWVYYVNGWTTPTGTSNGLVTPDSFNVYMTSSSAFTTRDCYIIEGGGWTASAEL